MVLNTFSLAERTGIITGAGQGLGKAFALAFAEAGADVVAAELSAESGAQTVAEIETLGRLSRFIETDVTRPESVDAMMSEVVDAFGRVGFMMNNAVIVHRDAAESLSDDDWLKVIDVNLNSLYYCFRAVGLVMIEQRAGSIINIASVSGSIVNTPQPQASYNASKAAVIQLTRSLASEWAPHHVRINSISPGYMKTAMTQSFLDDPAYGGKWIPAIPMKRPGLLQELTPAAVYLAADASCYTTGSNIVIDGGYTVL